MLGFRRQEKSEDARFDNGDVAKLFFDSFSTRLGVVEANVKDLSREIARVRASEDQFKLSDLVLLERLQKAETLLGESLGWVKQVTDLVLETRKVPLEPAIVNEASEPIRAPLPQSVSQAMVQKDPLHMQPGTLNSITTPTELQVLTILAEQGPKSAPEIGRLVGRSREHTARLMRRLFDGGYVRRDQSRIPFRYTTVERVKAGLAKTGEKNQTQETVSPAPS